MAEPDTRTGGPRRPGRAAILDRAADRFAEAGLDQVVGAIAGVRDVAAAAGAAPATINHHFPPGGDRRNTRLATAALTHALLGHELADERSVVARHLALAVAPRSLDDGHAACTARSVGLWTRWTPGSTGGRRRV